MTVKNKNEAIYIRMTQFLFVFTLHRCFCRASLLWYQKCVACVIQHHAVWQIGAVLWRCLLPQSSTLQVQAVHTYIPDKLHGGGVSQKSTVHSHCSDNSNVTREKQTWVSLQVATCHHLHCECSGGREQEGIPSSIVVFMVLLVTVFQIYRRYTVCN